VGVSAPALNEADITELVRRFYAAARRDPLLAPIFEPAVKDWDAHVALVAAFWASSLLGVRTYRGNPLAEHRKHPLTPLMFDRWLEIWGETAEAMFAPDVAALLKARAAMIAESLKLGVFGLPELKGG
jgi:hemoglobin